MNPPFQLFFCLTVLTCLLAARAQAQTPAAPAPKVLNLADYLAQPHAGTDATLAFQAALAEAARQTGPVILQIPKGDYGLSSASATKMEYHISNTSTDRVNQTKVIGLYLKGLKNLTIEGNGSLILCHGKMTIALLDACENVTIRNLHFDFARPTMSELTVQAIDGNTIDFQVHPDSTYQLKQNKITWTGEDWTSSGGTAQEYDPVSDTTWRCNDPVRPATSIAAIAPFQLRVTYAKPPSTKLGHVFQIRDGIRDEVGLLVLRSHHITLQNLGMHYMHGLGIVGQFTDTITLDGIDCSPRAATGRTCAGFADFMHFSGCRGKISVLNCNFSGAQDDALNIHGTHLRVEDRPAPNQILVAFRHPETWGFDAFAPGDEIDFTNCDTLLPFGTAQVVNAQRPGPHEILLTLDRPAPGNLRLKQDVVENVTWTPEVEIRNCRVARLPTRGFLVTTRRKVVIADNTFTRLPMPSILIADDARNWFESGMVRDVLIQGNHFINDASPVISIKPEARTLDPQGPVHENIRIEKNDFALQGTELVAAKSVKGLQILDNTFDEHGHATRPLIDLTGCEQVDVTGNIDQDKGGIEIVSTHQMEDGQITCQPDFRRNDAKP